MNILCIFSVSVKWLLLCFPIFIYLTQRQGMSAICTDWGPTGHSSSVFGRRVIKTETENGSPQTWSTHFNFQFQSSTQIKIENWVNWESTQRSLHGTKGKQGQLGNILFTNMEIGVGHNHGMATLMESMAHWLEIGFQNYQRGTTVPHWGSPKKEHW